jgi:hypothetical protein
MRKLFFLIALFSLLGFNFAYQENKEDITDNYKDAVFITDDDLIKFIPQNEAFWKLQNKGIKNNDIKLKSNTQNPGNQSPFEQSGLLITEKALLNVNAQFQTNNDFNPCAVPDCFYAKGPIIRNCLPNGGPCLGFDINKMRLILVFKQGRFKSFSSKIEVLQNGKKLTLASEKVKFSNNYLGFSTLIDKNMGSELTLNLEINGIKQLPIPISRAQ